jgi:hypothetical protein
LQPKLTEKSQDWMIIRSDIGWKMPDSTESVCAQGVVSEQLQKFGDFKMLAAIGFVKFLMFGKSSGLSRAICKMPGNSMAVFG